MAIDPRAAWALRDALRGMADGSGGATDVAEVTRVDNEGTVWVHLAGGVDETPVNGTKAAEVSAGDVVTVTVENGRLSIMGNPSAPSVGAEFVDGAVEPAMTAAAQAKTAAGIAEQAASGAQASAERAETNATRAQEAAEEAATEAESAKDAAEQAIEDAATAQASADAAQASADAAGTAATEANTAARGAVAGLGQVQDVIGTLDWIREHGTYALTEDVTVDPTKVYYTRSGTAPDYTYTPVAEPKDDELATYYELSINEALAEFVGAHLALLSDGLHVVSDASGYYIVLSNDAMRVYDPQNNLVATYGTTVQIGRSDESHVEMDFNSFKMVSKDDSAFAIIEDMRDANGLATLTEYFTVRSGTLAHQYYTQCSIDADEPVTLKVDGQPYAGSFVPHSAYVELFSPFPPAGSELAVTYETPDEITAYTFGKRGTGTIGPMSVAEGTETVAAGIAAHAEGEESVASGALSHAEGGGTTASGVQSHAEGGGTAASGDFSHAEGGATHAEAPCAHAEGRSTIASGSFSHAEGYQSLSSVEAAHAEGWNTTASGIFSHAEGCGTAAAAITSHAEGYGTDASGHYSHAEGYDTTASGDNSHAEGIGTTASGSRSHAEGGSTEASGASSHAEGGGTIASGAYSHAEGGSTTASSQCSHSEGYETKAESANQHVEGKYNIADANNTYAHIIGNGTSDSNRSNAYTVDWNGNVEAAGDLTAGGDVSDSTGTLDQVRQDSKDASNITSGTLPVSRGGTGKNSLPTNAVVLSNGTSAFKAAYPDNGALYATSSGGAPSFGTLPIAQGGTGATTASDAVKELTGRAWDFNTENTSDTWVPVATTVNGVGTWRHRAIPTNLATTPTSLWSGDSNGNITLSQSAANFTRITIYYRDNDNQYSSVDVYSPNGKLVLLFSTWEGRYNKMRSVNISGTSITTNRAYQMDAAGTASQATNLIYIVRVLGWKY